MRKKWIIMGSSLVAIGAVSLFLLKVTTHTQAPAASKSAPVVTDTPEHELKELAVQLQKKPGHLPVLLRMAQLEREKGDLDDAAGHLQDAIKSEPTNQDAHLELGRLLYERKDVSGAITETEKVLALNPKQVDALYNLGAIYANLGNADRARSYWQKAVTVDASADSGRKAREGLTKLGGS
jgi:Flp pilus assembly protein TadD